MNRIQPLANNTDELMVGFLHDLNNLFTCAIASLGLARSSDDDQHSKEEMIEVASKTIFRAAELASIMMEAVRGHNMSKEKMDVRDMLTDAVKFSKQVRAQIQIDLPQRACCTNANATSIVNVIINLLLNADRAIGGNETIQVRCLVDNGGVVCDSGLTRQMVRVSVENPNPEQTRSSESVSGDQDMLLSLRPHGIGLRIASTIIQQHGGSLTLRQQDQKTIAEFCLPLTQE